MAIYWGTTEIVAGKLNIGAGPVTAVFWGATQVWPPDAGPADQGPRVTEDGADERVTEWLDRRITEGGP